MAAPERLRRSLRSTPGPDGLDIYDEVDRDLLTPGAQALFDAVQQPYGGLDIPMRSRQTRREMGMTVGSFISDEDLDKTVFMSWRGWAYYPADSTMDIHEYLNREAMKIDPRYEVAGGTPHPARMTSVQVLAVLRGAGRPIEASTWRAYVKRGQAPAPIEYVGRTPVWSAEEIAAWINR